MRAGSYRSGSAFHRGGHGWWRHGHGGYGWVGPVFWPFAFYDLSDYAFWGYLFGLMAFWGGLSAMHSDSELNKVLYCLLNVGLVVLSPCAASG